MPSDTELLGTMY